MPSSLPSLSSALRAHYRPHHLLLALAAALSLLTLSQQQQVLPPFTPEPDEFVCENNTEIEFCFEIGYTLVSFPNFRDHKTQRDANNELINFAPLIRGVCSNAIVHLLCSIYAPFCQIGAEDIRVPPCRELCQYVRNTCEQPLTEFGLKWPPHLDCNRYQPDSASTLDFCPENLTALTIPSNIEINPPDLSTPNDVITTMTPSVITDPSTGNMSCPLPLRVGPNLQNQSYSFAGIPNCGVVCTGIYFTTLERNIVGPVFILLFAVVCVLFTAFTVLTFLIERHRFHYPERPIVFISFCYLVVSIVYMVGAISKLAGSENQAFSCSDDVMNSEGLSTSFVIQSLPNSESTYKTASCVILFVSIYFFQMASAIWWVILTLTWFLASALKWGEEAVEKLWLLYHIVAWGIPAIQVILVLALRLVDGDQLSGLCYTGNADNVGLGVFVFFPLLLYLSIGGIFFIIGFIALLNIKKQLERDVTKSKKISRLIVRVLVYSILYISPNTILLFLIIYELAQKSTWEEMYVQDCGGLTETQDDCSGSVSPSFAAFLLKYIMIFLVGIFSTSWILSSKTFAAWQKLFCRCCDNGDPGHVYDLPVQHKYDIPNPQHQFVLPEKHGDLSFHPHTAV